MSESIAQSYQECDERTGSIQSVWVTRWVGSGQNSTSQGFRTPNNPFESKKKSDGVELQSAGELRNIGSQTRQVVNQSFRAFSGNFRVESTHHSATMSMASRNDLPLRDYQEARECLSFKPPNDPNTTSATAISSGKNYSESEASLPNPIRRVKPHSFFRHSHTVASVPTVGNCIESVSHIVPYRFGYGKLKDDPTLTEMPLLVDRVSKSHLPNSTLSVIGDKQNHESEMESGRQSMKVNGDWFQKLQNGSRLAEFQNNYASLEATEPSKALNNICMSEELPHSLHDMKTMRICTTVDSVVGLKGCFPRFSQTTHSLLIVNESDVNICKQNQTVGTSRACNEFNKRIFSGLDKLPSTLSQKQQGVKLRLLDSCTDSDLEEDVGVVEPLDVDAKNESSAETDAMDFDASPGKTHLLGVSSSSLFKKECERGKKLCHLTPMEGVRSDGIKKNKTPPNNIVNSYTSGIPAEASSSDNVELSSNTHSMDMESFIIAHNDQNNNSNPVLFQSDLPGSDPSSRFVKRLKLSNLYNMALGTRSLNTKEDSSHECKKQHTRFHGKACSEPTSNKNKGKEWMVQDKRTTRNNVGESSSAAENLKPCRDKLTSYPWIQRLLRDRATKSLQIPEVVGGYEPGSACLEAVQIQKRHFPSIAAMALMGKGMKGFQPCRFQNKGSFVVWN